MALLNHDCCCCTTPQFRFGQQLSRVCQDAAGVVSSGSAFLSSGIKVFALTHIQVVSIYFFIFLFSGIRSVYCLAVDLYIFDIKIDPANHSFMKLTAINTNCNDRMRRWKKSKCSKYISRVFGFASNPTTGGPASGKSEQKSPQPALSPPTQCLGRRLLNKLKWACPGVKHCNNTMNQLDGVLASPSTLYSATSTPQIHTRPNTACSETSTLQTLRPPTAGSKISHSQSEPITSQNHGSSPTLLTLYPQPEPTANYNLSTYAPHICTCQVQTSVKVVVDLEVLPQTTARPNIMEPSSVWVKTLEIANKKLSDNKLPPLDLANLTSPLAEENIQAIVRELNTIQEDGKKQRWSYTWRGKKVIVVERLGEILKSMQNYTKVADIAVQSNPKISALVWAGVYAIMRVRI